MHSVNSKIVGIMDRVSDTHRNINYAGDLNTPGNWKLDSSAGTDHVADQVQITRLRMH